MLRNIKSKEGKMKGQAYAFIMVFLSFMIVLFLWVILNHASIEVTNTLSNLTNSTEHHDLMNLCQSLVYYSLLFIFIFSFLYLLKLSLERGEG